MLSMPKAISLPLLALIAALGLALGLTACGGEVKKVPDNAVALVGGSPVLKIEFDKIVEQAKRSYGLSKRDFPKVGSPEYEALKNNAVKFLVERLQFRLAAQELGIQVTDPQVEERLVELKKQYFNGDESAYRTQLEKSGVTEQEVLENIRLQLTQQKLFQVITDDVDVTEAQLRIYYDQNPTQYSQPSSRDVRHILVKKRSKALELYRMLKGGADFAALAKKYSKDPGSRDNGGQLTVTPGQTVPPFDKAAFSLDTGKLSKPVKTEFGYHLIEAVSDVRPASSTSFDEAKKSIRELLESQQRNEAVAKWVEELRKRFEGKVIYALGYTPPQVTTTAPTRPGPPGDNTGQTTGQ